MVNVAKIYAETKQETNADVECQEQQKPHDASQDFCSLGDFKSQRSHRLSDYDEIGISDVIDKAIWVQLGERTKNNIRNFVAAKNRPNTIDSELWAELDSEDKAIIIQKNYGRTAELERPEEINSDTWDRLNNNTRKAIIGRLYILRPPGFDAVLWENISDLAKKCITDDLCETKHLDVSEKLDMFKRQSLGFINGKIDNFINNETSSAARWWLLRMTVNSRVLTFFFSEVHVIEDPDAGIGAMVLVCALILTIPFSAFSFINDSFLSALKSAIEACPNQKSHSGESFDFIHHRMNISLTACMYFSMMGLIISSVYYVFKPLPGKEIDRWCRCQGRVLIMSLFCVTGAAIAALMTLGLYLIEYSLVRLDESCTYSVDALYFPGIAGLAVSFFIALACMW